MIDNYLLNFELYESEDKFSSRSREW